MSTKGTEITARDQKLLRVLFDYGVLTSRQIGAWFFKGVEKTTVLRRLRKLEHDHYIRKRGILTNGVTVFVIGENGAKYLGEIMPITTYPFQQLEHETQITNLRWFLETLGAVKSWMSERALRSDIARQHGTKDRSKFIVPDGLILFRNFMAPNQKVAFEMELHLKNKGRYKEKFRRLEVSPVFIWYIVKNRSMAKQILTLAHEFAPERTKSQIALTTIEDLEALGLAANVYRIYDFKPLNEVLDLKLNPAQGSAHTVSTPKTEQEKKMAA